MTLVRIAPSGPFVDVLGAPTAINVGTRFLPTLGFSNIGVNTQLVCYTCPSAGTIMVFAMVNLSCAAGGSGMIVDVSLDGNNDFNDGLYQSTTTEMVSVGGATCYQGAMVSYSRTVFAGEDINFQVAGAGGVFSTPLNGTIYLNGWLV
jgi:hypothetical protein